MLVTVPFDSAADCLVDNLQPEITISYVHNRKQTTHLFNQPSKQNKLIRFRISKNLKPVA
ncbi:hypothetical protein PAMC26577_38695 [Caballeronia sordidicola]|uniref:Uncharacterized protein n=1 Tax=Caballeronia sordidicola TaxID=196367 RepID=A0A242M539_CABSO|nr:hypothetical protein PAMC26577_38695 [Caballeronia sordidicola]